MSFAMLDPGKEAVDKRIAELEAEVERLRPIDEAEPVTCKFSTWCGGCAYEMTAWSARDHYERLLERLRWRR